MNVPIPRETPSVAPPARRIEPSQPVPIPIVSPIAPNIADSIDLSAPNAGISVDSLHQLLPTILIHPIFDSAHGSASNSRSNSMQQGPPFSATGRLAQQSLGSGTPLTRQSGFQVQPAASNPEALAEVATTVSGQATPTSATGSSFGVHGQSPISSLTTPRGSGLPSGAAQPLPARAGLWQSGRSLVQAV